MIQSINAFKKDKGIVEAPLTLVKCGNCGEMIRKDHACKVVHTALDKGMKTIIQERCPTCGKLAQEKSRSVVIGDVYIILDCGHTMKKATDIKVIDKYEIESSDGRSLLGFQIKTIKAIEATGDYCFIVAHDVGLGKTVIGEGLIKLHPEMFPVLAVVKGGLRRQWFAESIRWQGLTPEGMPTVVPQIMDASTDKPFPEIFKIALIGYDVLPSMSWIHDKKITGKYKTIIFDECQMIKNPDAKRTKACRILSEGIPHRLALSATPIKNSGREWFTILNIIKPTLFPIEAQFEQDWLDGYGAIKRHRLKEWNSLLSSFYLRYEREEVMPDLPKIFRQYHYDDLSKDVEAAYKKELIKFNEAFDEAEMSGKSKSLIGNILAYMTRMKYLTGVSKIQPVADFMDEYLENTSRKIVLFVHHQDVGNMMEVKIKAICERLKIEPPLRIHQGLNDVEKDKVAREFTANPLKRVLICRTLAEGEGHNFQVASDAIVMEREWNPANEEQAEGRFPRIGSIASQVNIHYFVAVGTIDEFLARLVEKKRQICRQSMGKEVVSWVESSIMKELADLLRGKGKQAWALPA